MGPRLRAKTMGPVYCGVVAGSHVCKGDEGDALEAAGVREAHQIHVLNLATVTPVITHLFLLHNRRPPGGITAFLSHPC